eukprot:TRINITY_DN929_c0_g1_i1.p1 TRINITY_DN929_c0_g1~~TRINITY_DN929_c0_g1_i1.p1  ORF type:complete len:212 (-),score=57.24 TRINITY_DN929_c0_g1_i1:46-639(-)
MTDYHFGLDADLKRKQDSKWDQELADEVMAWVSNVTGTRISSIEDLKNGLVLCDLANRIRPGSVNRVSTMNMAFKHMDNIGKFLSALDSLGVMKTDQFMTVDLYEEKNLLQVVLCLSALGAASRNIAGFNGPYIGARVSQSNVRDFSEETLREGRKITPQLSQGSHGGATQAGMHDTSRDIVKGPGAREAARQPRQP